MGLFVLNSTRSQITNKGDKMLEAKKIIEAMNQTWEEAIKIDVNKQPTTFISKIAQIEAYRLVLGREKLIE